MIQIRLLWLHTKEHIYIYLESQQGRVMLNIETVSHAPVACKIFLVILYVCACR